MKPIKKLSLFSLSCIFCFLILISGCKKYDYSQYYNLSTFKGIEVYCWETDGEWLCCAFGGTNRFKTVEEIAKLQEELPCPLTEMNKILKTYSDEERRTVSVFVVEYPLTKSDLVGYNHASDFPEYVFLYERLGLSTD